MSAYIEVKVDLSQIDDGDLLDEIESRGLEGIPKDIMEDVIWRYKMGQVGEAVFILENYFPDLHGLSKRIH